MTLTMDPLTPGEPVSIEIYNAIPGTFVDILRSNGGLGEGPCPGLLGGGCMSILPGSSNYIPTLRGRADADGRLSWALPSFPALPFSDWYFQAVTLDSGNSNLSNALYRPIGGGCLDDAFEHNDRDVDAAPLSQGAHNGLISCVGDDDWYAISVPAGQVVRVDASHDTDDGDLDIRLFNTTGAELDRSSSVLGSEMVEWQNPGAATTVLLRAYLFDGGDTPYGLEVQVGAPDAPCVDDPGEDNDTAADASVLLVGGGVACALDDDWFVYDLEDDEVLVLDVEADGGLLDVLLYDSLGQIILSDLEPPHDIIYPSDGAQTVWAVVRQDADDLLGGGVDYLLNSAVVTEGACADDGFEDNDTSATARIAPVGTEVTARACNEDDWYRVPVVSGDSVFVDLDIEEGDGTVDVFLYDTIGQLIDSDTQAPYRLSGLASVNGPWHIEVSPDSDDATGDGVGYRWTTTVVTPTACRNDGYEPNDDVLTPTDLPLGEVRVGVVCTGDEDWYRMPVSAGSTVRFTVTTEEPDERIELFLLDGGGVQVDVAAGEGSATVERVGVPADNNYLLRVVLAEDDPSGGGATYQASGAEIPFDPCIEDRFESNDDLANALPTPSGVSRSAVSCDGNADWFGTLGAAGDLVRVSLDYLEEDGSLDLFVYDANGVLVTSDTFPPHEVEFFAEDAGAWYAEVVFDGDDIRGGGVPYEVTMTATPPAPCFVDELEPNDSDLEAVTIATGRLTASVCLADSDWYEFVADLGDLIVVDASYTTLGGDQNVDLILYDDTLTVLDEGDFQLTTPETVQTIAAYTGVYFVEVIAGADDALGGGVDYTLDVLVAPISDCVVDAFEPNNNQAVASPTGGVPQTAESCDGDDDWWYVDAAAGDLVRFALNYSILDGSLDLLLYDANGDELDADVVPPNAVSGVTTVTGRVYARVVLDSNVPPSDGVAYTIGSLVDSPDPCLTDAQEPDNTRGAATPLAVGNTLGGTACTTDSDWVSISAVAGDRIIVIASYPTLGATQDVDLNFYDDAGVLLAVGDLDLTTPETIDIIAPYTGTYFVEVFAELDDAAGEGVDYALSVQLTSLAVCVEDGFESNNTVPTATTLAIGQTRSAQSCDADDDVYRVDLAAGEAVVLSVDYSAADGEVDLALVDAGGAPIASDAFAPLVLSYQASSAESLYAIVQHDRDDTTVGGGVAYQVTASTLPDCVDDGLEPNDDLAEATPGPGSWSGLSACTEVGTSSNPGGDYFEVPLLAGEVLDVDLSFIHAEGDLDVQILDDGGSQLASSTSGTDDEQVSWTALVDGTVYVRVRMWRDAGVGQFGNTYDLTISVP